MCPFILMLVHMSETKSFYLLQTKLWPKLFSFSETPHYFTISPLNCDPLSLFLACQVLLKFISSSHLYLWQQLTGFPAPLVFSIQHLLYAVYKRIKNLCKPGAKGNWQVFLVPASASLKQPVQLPSCRKVLSLFTAFFRDTEKAKSQQIFPSGVWPFSCSNRRHHLTNAYIFPSNQRLLGLLK